MLGGDTFGIADYDAFYCKPGSKEFGCEKSSRSGYVDHSVNAPNLAQQLDSRGISWKGYLEDIPEPGSLAFPRVLQSLFAAVHVGKRVRYRPISRSCRGQRQGVVTMTPQFANSGP